MKKLHILISTTLILASSFSLSFTPNESKIEIRRTMENQITTKNDSLYLLDKGHSFISFKATRFGISKVLGAFNDISGNLDCIENCRAKIEIQANSLNSNLEIRDKQLKGEKFLDVADHPIIFANLNKIERENGKYIADIEITLLNMTKFYEVPVEFIKVKKDPTGKETIALSGNFIIDRMDYNMKMNKVLSNGIPLIGNDVELDFSLLFEKQ